MVSPPPAGWLRAALRPSSPQGPAPLGLLGLLWLLALALALIGLNNLPLRDWDEGIVARVALETSLAPWHQKWLPTYWGVPYLNKPPGLHLLIAACLGLWRWGTGASAASLPPELVLRLVPAFLSTLVVPLVGLIQWRLRPGDRLSTLASAAIALTLLPLARHGRLVLLDGAQLSAMALLWWGLLQLPSAGERGAVRWGAVVGLAGSALLLLKAPLALPLLAGSLLIRWFDRDLSPRRGLVVLVAIAVGLLPGLVWHGAHLLARGDAAWQMWTSQGFRRVVQGIEGHGGSPLEPVLEILEGGWPWLPLWPLGLAMAWRQRGQRWARWCLGLTLLTAALVLPLRTQLPWYSLLLWPPFALLCGPALAWLVRRPAGSIPPAGWWLRRLPWFWLALGAVLLLASAGLLLHPALRGLAPCALLLGTGLAAGGRLLVHPDRRLRLGGLIVQIGGLWLALAWLMAGPWWLWELNESWATPGLGALVQGHAIEGPVYILQEAERPSLSWYAGLPVRSLESADQAPVEGGGSWLLLSRQQAPGQANHCRPLERSAEWNLYRCGEESLSRRSSSPPAVPG